MSFKSGRPIVPRVPGPPPTAPPKQAAAISKRLTAIPRTMRSVYDKAVGGHSRSAAIKAFCQECCGYNRAAIRDCTALACPLWPYRPYQTEEESDDAVAAEPSEEVA